MSQSESIARARAEGKIAEIQRTITAMQYLSSGTLLKRTKVCGNPGCRCAHDPAARHGPYYEWSYLKGGRLHHRSLTPKQADLILLSAHRRGDFRVISARLATAIRVR